MRRPVTARDRFRYRFDTFMSRGPIALVGALGLASLLVILVGAALVHGLGVAPADAEGHRPGFVTLIWMAGMRAMDAGAVGGDDGSRLYLALMLAVTLGGIFVVSALIGVLTSGLGAKLNNLHKGRSRVIEDGHTLILGWSAQVFTVVSELDKYAVAGSELTIIADDETPGRDLDALEADLVNHKVTLVQGDINDRRVLDEARVSGFQHVITLSYADRFGVQQGDAVTLVTLLHLRDIEEKLGDSFSVVSEVLDARNQKLAEVTGTDDFIVSENLVSLLLAQLAENKALAAVFEDSFDADGAEIYLKDAAVGPRAPRLNPKKSERVTFAAGDRVVVLASS